MAKGKGESPTLELKSTTAERGLPSGRADQASSGAATHPGRKPTAELREKNANDLRFHKR